jgi:hypothetical protein
MHRVGDMDWVKGYELKKKADESGEELIGRATEPGQ